MQIIDWNQRWQQNQIGFHESQVNQYLAEFIGQFKLPTNATIFVPLCGKSNDLQWLAQHGYKVIGIECSALAVTDFFKHNNLSFDTASIDDFTVYHSGNITIYQGDFFALNQSHLKHCDLIYDRASLIAFSAEHRAHYVSHLNTWFSATTQMLLITLCYDQSIMQGPPFSVSNADVELFYKHKEIQQLKINDVIDEGPRWRKMGLNSLIETAFQLSH